MKISGIASFTALAVLSTFVIAQTNADDIKSLRSRFLQQSFPDEFPLSYMALQMLILAKGIYSVTLENILERLTYQPYNLKYFKETAFSTDAGVITTKEGGYQGSLEKDIIVAVFRGSEEIDDWVVNFDFDLIQCVIPGCPDGAKLHSGFQDSLFDNEDVIYDVENAIMELIDSDLDLDTSTVYVAGHSLGGALAQVAATYLASTHPDINFKMMSFGQPRVGNANFAEWANEFDNLSAWRFVNDFDPVPRTPLNVQGYQHAGHLMDMKTQRCSVYYRQVGSNELGYSETYDSWYISGLNGFDHLGSSYLGILENKQDKPVWWPGCFQGDCSN